MPNPLYEKLSPMLTLPGSGVFTIHTAKEKRLSWLEHYYQTTDPQQQLGLWAKEWDDFLERPLGILGIPSDCGGGILRGANWGPLFLREAYKDDSTWIELGDIKVIPHLLHDKYLNPATIEHCQKALYGEMNGYPVSPLSIAESVCLSIYQNVPAARLISLGGDHSVSYPLVKSWLLSRTRPCGLLHFDAHTDLLDERLGIDLCFGSWVYHVLPFLPSNSHCVQVGIRSSGKNQSHWEGTFGLIQHWASEVREIGITALTDKIISHYKKLGIEELYISIDIDVLDEKYVSATGTPEPGGLELYHLVEIIRLLSAHFEITSADLAEVAPMTRGSKACEQEPFSTLEHGRQLILVLQECMEGKK